MSRLSARLGVDPGSTGNEPARALSVIRVVRTVHAFEVGLLDGADLDLDRRREARKSQQRDRRGSWTVVESPAEGAIRYETITNTSTRCRRNAVRSGEEGDPSG